MITEILLIKTKRLQKVKKGSGMNMAVPNPAKDVVCVPSRARIWTFILVELCTGQRGNPIHQAYGLYAQSAIRHAQLWMQIKQSEVWKANDYSLTPVFDAGFITNTAGVLNVHGGNRAYNIFVPRQAINQARLWQRNQAARKITCTVLQNAGHQVKNAWASVST